MGNICRSNKLKDIDKSVNSIRTDVIRAGGNLSQQERNHIVHRLCQLSNEADTLRETAENEEFQHLEDKIKYLMHEILSKDSTRTGFNRRSSNDANSSGTHSNPRQQSYYEVISETSSNAKHHHRNSSSDTIKNIENTIKKLKDSIQFAIGKQDINQLKILQQSLSNILKYLEKVKHGSLNNHQERLLTKTLYMYNKVGKDIQEIQGKMNEKAKAEVMNELKVVQANVAQLDAQLSSIYDTKDLSTLNILRQNISVYKQQVRSIKLVDEITENMKLQLLTNLKYLDTKASNRNHLIEAGEVLVELQKNANQSIINKENIMQRLQSLLDFINHIKDDDANFSNLKQNMTHQIESLRSFLANKNDGVTCQPRGQSAKMHTNVLNTFNSNEMLQNRQFITYDIQNETAESAMKYGNQCTEATYAPMNHRVLLESTVESEDNLEQTIKDIVEIETTLQNIEIRFAQDPGQSNIDNLEENIDTLKIRMDNIQYNENLFQRKQACIQRIDDILTKLSEQKYIIATNSISTIDSHFNNIKIEINSFFGTKHDKNFDNLYRKLTELLSFLNKLKVPLNSELSTKREELINEINLYTNKLYDKAEENEVIKQFYNKLSCISQIISDYKGNREERIKIDREIGTITKYISNASTVENKKNELLQQVDTVKKRLLEKECNIREKKAGQFISSTETDLNNIERRINNIYETRNDNLFQELNRDIAKLSENLNRFPLSHSSKLHPKRNEMLKKIQSYKDVLEIYNKLCCLSNMINNYMGKECEFKDIESEMQIIQQKIRTILEEQNRQYLQQKLDTHVKVFHEKEFKIIENQSNSIKTTIDKFFGNKSDSEFKELHDQLRLLSGRLKTVSLEQNNDFQPRVMELVKEIEESKEILQSKACDNEAVQKICEQFQYINLLTQSYKGEAVELMKINNEIQSAHEKIETTINEERRKKLLNEELAILTKSIQEKHFNIKENKSKVISSTELNLDNIKKEIDTFCGTMSDIRVQELNDHLDSLLTRLNRIKLPYDSEQDIKTNKLVNEIQVCKDSLNNSKYHTGQVIHKQLSQLNKMISNYNGEIDVFKEIVTLMELLRQKIGAVKVDVEMRKLLNQQYSSLLKYACEKKLSIMKSIPDKDQMQYDVKCNESTANVVISNSDTYYTEQITAPSNTISDLKAVSINQNVKKEERCMNVMRKGEEEYSLYTDAKTSHNFTHASEGAMTLNGTEEKCMKEFEDIKKVFNEMKPQIQCFTGLKSDIKYFELDENCTRLVLRLDKLLFERGSQRHIEKVSLLKEIFQYGEILERQSASNETESRCSQESGVNEETKITKLDENMSFPEIETDINEIDNCEQIYDDDELKTLDTDIVQPIVDIDVSNEPAQKKVKLDTSTQPSSEVNKSNLVSNEEGTQKDLYKATEISHKVVTSSGNGEVGKSKYIEDETEAMHMKELSGVEQIFETLKSEIENFIGSKSDSKYFELDENCTRLVLRLDRLKLKRGSKGHAEKVKLLKEIYKYGDILYNKVNKGN